MIYHLGVDDVDSPSGGCTTHLAVKLAALLVRSGARLVDYPNLVRLNPAVPWKTRGNGAVALRFESGRDPGDLLGMVAAAVEEYAAEFPNPKHQPAVALLEGAVPDAVRAIGKKALHDIVPLPLLERALEKSGVMTWTARGRRGLVGAVAAIGNEMLEGDFTFEALFYRVRENYGRPRLVDAESVAEAERASGGLLFLNYDESAGRLLAAPHGPDPVLLGIRGETAEAVAEAAKRVRVLEEVEAVVVFRTNQHTDAHLARVESLCQAFPYRCVWARGVVSRRPRRIQGGHVVLSISDGACEIDAAAYEPTKEFRDAVGELEVGDEVEALGCVRPPSPWHPATLNLEKLRVVRLAPKYVVLNPRCPRCGARMESAGRGKGYRCPKCGFRGSNLEKEKTPIPRRIREGWYQPPKHAFKHLMKPLERFGAGPKAFSYRPVDPFLKPPPGPGL